MKNSQLIEFQRVTTTQSRRKKHDFPWRKAAIYPTPSKHVNGPKAISCQFSQSISAAIFRIARLLLARSRGKPAHDRCWRYPDGPVGALARALAGAGGGAGWTIRAAPRTTGETARTTSADDWRGVRCVAGSITP
jgi:hypothetical protein